MNLLEREMIGNFRAALSREKDRIGSNLSPDNIEDVELYLELGDLEKLNMGELKEFALALSKNHFEGSYSLRNGQKNYSYR